MARKTKARARSASSKKKATTRKKKTKAATRQKSKAKKAGGKRGSDVERRWAHYLKQRTALEVAVGAVQDAAGELASARGVEQARRKDFDESKRSLEQLLEVEAPTGRPGRDRKPLDFPGKLPHRDRSEEPEASRG